MEPDIASLQVTHTQISGHSRAGVLIRDEEPPGATLLEDLTLTGGAYGVMRIKPASIDIATLDPEAPVEAPDYWLPEANNWASDAPYPLELRCVPLMTWGCSMGQLGICPAVKLPADSHAGVYALRLRAPLRNVPVRAQLCCVDADCPPPKDCFVAVYVGEQFAAGSEGGSRPNEGHHPRRIDDDCNGVADDDSGESITCGQHA